MSEQMQESLKVYELAKELGLDSFSLLDKLKKINIEVKSHMSSLAMDQANAIREAIRKEQRGGSAAPTSEGGVKKRAKAPASTISAGSAATAAGAPTAASPTTAVKKIVKKASAPSATASESKPTASAASTQQVAPASTEAPKKKVIKRRSETESAEPVAATSAPVMRHEEPAQEEQEIQHELHPQEPEAHVEPEQEAPTIVAAAPAAPATPHIPHVEKVVPTKAAGPLIKPVAPTMKAAGPIITPVEKKPNPIIEEIMQRTNAPGTKAYRTPQTRVLERDELIDEGTTRRLKIVQAAPPGGIKREVQPTYRTPGAPTGEKKKVLPQKTSAGGTEMFQPMVTYVQKEEEVRGKKSTGAKTTNPEDVRITDFRKRELVFQPKRKKLPPGKQIRQTQITEMAAHKKKIRVEDKIIVSDLAQRMGEKANAVMAKLIALGSMVTINQTIDFDTATLIATEFGWEIENVAFNEKQALETGTEADANLKPRPPIITVMGHVDHGKTSLLDAIRNAKVASGEAGGITQHIGAYSITTADGKAITFLDTPGHEAFANMRSRGANLTDIVILVVAGDDSIMPQTKEAIAHSIAAKVPMIVAVNKMDKPDANIERVKKDLSANNVLVEDWGGEVPLVPVSALKKTGIDDLIETILLQAEVLNLTADPNRPAEGVVLEARMEKGRGVVTDLLVKKGTLHAGDYIVVGTAYGRVRAMINDLGKNITEVLPGYPAEVIGLNDVPAAGDTFYIVKNEEAAKDIAENRRKKLMEEKAIALQPKTMTLEELMAKIPVPGLKELNLIVKADVYGSAEAIKESIEKIVSAKVKAKVLSCNVGVVTENDVQMARSSGAIILGFNSKPDSKARELAKKDNVDIRHYSIIYQLLDDVRAAMENLLAPIRKETLIGKADVKQVFTVSRLGTVAGSTCADGKITRNSFARVMRGKDAVHEGKVVSLRRFKDDVSEIIKGQECGIGIEGYEAFLPGDIINVYNVELVKQSL